MHYRGSVNDFNVIKCCWLYAGLLFLMQQLWKCDVEGVIHHSVSLFSLAPPMVTSMQAPPPVEEPLTITKITTLYAAPKAHPEMDFADTIEGFGYHYDEGSFCYTLASVYSVCVALGDERFWVEKGKNLQILYLKGFLLALVKMWTI